MTTKGKDAPSEDEPRASAKKRRKPRDKAQPRSGGSTAARPAAERERSSAERAAVETEGDRPVRVLFIHPAYPSQFSAIGSELNRVPGFECFGLVHNAMGAQVVATEGGMQHFGFQPDGQTSANSYPYTQPFEYAARNATGIAGALMALKQAYRFDAVVGHAAFGASIYLKAILDCALISYAELPSFQSAAARLEFPSTLDTVFAGCCFETLVHASILNSDLGVVPSEYTKRLYPVELQPKIRVQMEGFDAERIPAGDRDDRAAFGLPLENRLIGFFGRTLEAVRGFDIFLQVARRLYDADQSLRFLVIGEEQSIYGNEMRYIQGSSFKQYALAQSGLPEEAIIWRRTLPYDEFRRQIACVDLAILPLFEGAANWNLFEAMAVGLPIISSNRCFVPEVITDGTEGILLDPYNVAGFVEKASELLKKPDLANRLGEAARARIRKHYSMKQALDGYGRIIKEAISLHRGRQK